MLHGVVRSGRAESGLVRLGKARFFHNHRGSVRSGAVSSGKARSCKVWFGFHNLWFGSVRHGVFRQGEVWFGRARFCFMLPWRGGVW